MLLGDIQSGCQHNMYLLLAELERRMLADGCFLIAWWCNVVGCLTWNANHTSSKILILALLQNAKYVLFFRHISSCLFGQY